MIAAWTLLALALATPAGEPDHARALALPPDCLDVVGQARWDWHLGGERAFGDGAFKARAVGGEWTGLDVRQLGETWFWEPPESVPARLANVGFLVGRRSDGQGVFHQLLAGLEGAVETDWEQPTDDGGTVHTWQLSLEQPARGSAEIRVERGEDGAVRRWVADVHSRRPVRLGGERVRVQRLSAEVRYSSGPKGTTVPRTEALSVDLKAGGQTLTGRRDVVFKRFEACVPGSDFQVRPDREATGSRGRVTEARRGS